MKSMIVFLLTGYFLAVTLGGWTRCDYDSECPAGHGCRNSWCAECAEEGEDCAWSNRAAPLCCKSGLKCDKEGGRIGHCRKK